MKRKNIIRILIICIVICSALTLSACDFLGGGNADVTLYHLKLSSNIPDVVKQEDLVATLAYGERHDVHVRPQDEVDQYLSAGATQEDIDKTSVRQEDGSYYFFDADPIIITVPEGEDIPGYRFLGIYDKSTDQLAYRPMLTKCQLDDGSEEMLMSRWNMLDKDVELEARYETLKYKVSYVDNNGLIANPTNPTEYDASVKLNVELNAPAEAVGLNFKNWYYMQEVADSTAQKKVTCTSLPNFFDDTIIHFGTDGLGMTLFADYEDKYYTPTIVVKDILGETVTGLDDCIEIRVSDNAGDIPLADSYKHGTWFGIYVDTASLGHYELEGLYLDGVKIPDIGIGGELTRVCNVIEQFALTKDVNVEVRVKLCDYGVSFLFCDSLYCPIDLGTCCDAITICGDATKVNGNLATDPVTLDKECEIKTTYDTSFVVHIELKAGYTVEGCDIDGEVENVRIVEEGGEVDITCTITGKWAQQSVQIRFGEIS